MTIQEATYWNTEIADSEIDQEADAGEFLLAALAIINAGELTIRERTTGWLITRAEYEQLPDYLKPLYDEAI